MSEEVRHFKIEFKDYEDLDVVEYKEYQKLYKEIERLNNDIKELLKENGNKEKVIKAQDSIIKEVREYIEKHLEREYFNYDILEANTIYNRDLYKVLKILDKENK